ncbi:MAG: hypothetical protein HGB05_13420, partial [Chloroflexi bacterium]|nr:hypothetical protein [Chloroflexota bacterium]
MTSTVGEAVASAVDVGVDVCGLRVGRRVGVDVNVAVVVAVKVGVAVLVAVAVAVADGVDVLVAVGDDVGEAVIAPAFGTTGASRTVALFKRSLMMNPASKAMTATSPIISGTCHDRRLIGSAEPGGMVIVSSSASCMTIVPPGFRALLNKATISDAVAETMVDLGIDWSHVETLSDLSTGLMVALNVLGLRLS